MPLDPGAPNPAVVAKHENETYRIWQISLEYAEKRWSVLASVELWFRSLDRRQRREDDTHD